jgi:DNA-binding beta-propeller fold protein YncE
MAPRKTKSRKVPQPAGSSLPPSSPVPAGLNKWVVRGLLAAVVVFCAIEYFNHSSTEAEKDYKVQTVLSIDGNSTKCGPINVWGIAPVGKDKVMVADHGNNRMLIFDRKGNCVKSLGPAKSGPLSFHEPSGMTSDDKGNAYVIDTWAGIIKGFNEDGKVIANIPLPAAGSFYGPRGIAWDGGHFVVADTGSQRVDLVSADGNLEATWGSRGKEPGQFQGPLDAAVEPSGDILVADSDNCRLQWLDPSGKVKKVLRFKAGVASVAADKEGRFYISAANREGQSCIKAYDANGNYLGDLRDEKQNLISGAYGLTTGPGDILMVAGGTSVALYQLPSATP